MRIKSCDFDYLPEGEPNFILKILVDLACVNADQKTVFNYLF